MAVEILYDSEHVRILGRKGSSAYGVLSFGPATQFARGTDFWGDRVADKADLTMVGVMSHRPNWFPSEDMARAERVVRSHFEGLHRIISYGSSMGGYGSIKFGRMFAVTHALSFAPQWSIDPADVGAWDRRFAHNFNPKLHTNCAINREDSDAAAVLFFDPFHAQDKRNAELIAQSCPSTTLIPSWLMGHFPIHAFAGTDRSVALFQMCLQGDIAAMRRTMTERRRDPQLGTRARTLADILISTDVNAARRVFVVHRDKFGPRETAMLHHVMSGELLRQKRLDEAVECSDIALGNLPDMRDFHIRRSLIESERNSHSAAIRFAETAVRRWPAISTYRRLADAFVAGGDPARAVEILERSAEENIGSVQTYRQLVETCIGLPRWSKAVVWAEKLVQYAPEDWRAHDLLARAYKGFGNPGRSAAEQKESRRLRGLQEYAIQAEATSPMREPEPRASATSILSRLLRRNRRGADHIRSLE